MGAAGCGYTSGVELRASMRARAYVQLVKSKYSLWVVPVCIFGIRVILELYSLLTSGKAG